MTRTKVANNVETQINNYSIRFVSQLFEILDDGEGYSNNVINY